MKRNLIAAALFAAAALLWANGNAEKLSDLDGTVTGMQVTGTQAMIQLRLQDGTGTEVMVPAGEAQRLMIRVQDRVQVRGVLVQGDPTTQTPARMYARQWTNGSGNSTIAEPIKLTQRDRDRLRLQTDASGTGTQERTRTESGGSSGSSEQKSGK